MVFVIIRIRLTDDCGLLFHIAGTRLLTAGEVIQMWQTSDPSAGSTSGPLVEFYFDEQENSSSPSVFAEWFCIWQCRPATPVTLVKLSSDSLLFATIGKVRSCPQCCRATFFYLQ